MANELTIDTTQPDAPEFNEAEQEAIAVGEQLVDQQEQLLAGKYKDAEALEKAYLELQTKLGEPLETQQEASEEEQVESPSDTSVFDTAASEWAEKGELSSETMAALKELPSEELLNAYIAAQQEAAPAKDLSDQEVNTIYNSVGGEESYNSLVSWASETLQPSAINAFNEVVNGGSAEAVQLVLAGFKAAYDQQNGYEGRMLTGKAPSSAADVFRSQAEVVAAMQDPRYDRDPAYRNDVFQKLDRSNIQF